MKDKRICQYSKCNRPSEIIIRIHNKEYRVCLHHYWLIERKLIKKAEECGEASLDDLQVFTNRKGEIIRISI